MRPLLTVYGRISHGRVVEQGPVLRGRHPHSPEVKGAPAGCRSGVIRYGRTLLTSIAIS